MWKVIPELIRDLGAYEYLHTIRSEFYITVTVRNCGKE